MTIPVTTPWWALSEGEHPTLGPERPGRAITPPRLIRCRRCPGLQCNRALPRAITGLDLDSLRLCLHELPDRSKPHPLPGAVDQTSGPLVLHLRFRPDLPEFVGGAGARSWVFPAAGPDDPVFRRDTLPAPDGAQLGDLSVPPGSELAEICLACSPGDRCVKGASSGLPDPLRLPTSPGLRGVDRPLHAPDLLDVRLAEAVTGLVGLLACRGAERGPRLGRLPRHVRRRRALRVWRRRARHGHRACRAGWTSRASHPGRT